MLDFGDTFYAIVYATVAGGIDHGLFPQHLRHGGFHRRPEVWRSGPAGGGRVSQTRARTALHDARVTRL